MRVALACYHLVHGLDNRAPVRNPLKRLALRVAMGLARCK